MVCPINVQRIVAGIAVVAVGMLHGCSPRPSKPAAVPGNHAGSGRDHDHGGVPRPAVAPVKPDREEPVAPMPQPPVADKEPADHDHEEHAPPATLAEGVSRLTEATAEVKKHVSSDTPAKADDAVHELGHLLEDLQGLVGKSTLAAEGKASATKALDDLFECFGKLDEALHAEPGKGESVADVHASMAKRVDAAVAAFRDAVTPKQPAPVTPEPVAPEPKKPEPKAPEPKSPEPKKPGGDDEAASIIEEAKQKENR